MAYYEHITILPNNQIKCNLCEDILEDNNQLIEVHIHDTKHKEHFMENLMITNNITLTNSRLYCNICSYSIEISELICHVQSTEHQGNLTAIQKLLSLDGNLIESPGMPSSQSFAHCTICDDNIKYAQEALINHMYSLKHKQARAMVLQPLNGIFSVEDNDKYLWCKICQIFFDNYIEIIFQHVEESDHAKRIAKIMRLIDGQNIDIENYLQNVKEDRAMCNKCGIEVPCNIDNLQSHIKGKKHKN